MSQFQLFQPGQYLPFEEKEVSFRQSIFEGKTKLPPPPFPPSHPYTEEEILAYNKKWNPFDPLYNDPAYARAHGHPSVPAYPGFDAMAPIMSVPGFPKDMADGFYYTNDGTVIHYFRNIYAGDHLNQVNEKKYFEDRTKPGTEVRIWYMGGECDSVDQDGRTVYHISGNVRDCYRKYRDDVDHPPFDFSKNMASWVEKFPPAHITTDADYERMKTIWDQEKIMGDDTPLWEDVPVGYELPQTCSDGPVTYMHMMYWHQIGDLSIYSREELMDPKVRAVTFRDQWGEFLDETALHFAGRNIPGARGVWYNDTGARLVARTLTNFVGNKGRVSRFSWRFFPFFEELRTGPLCADMFNKVPGMEGRDCDRHGAQGDTCIGRAVVTDKYINEQGEHCCEVMLWGEDLEGNIVQGCPSEIVLPSREG